MIVLDTNVVSAVMRAAPDRAVVAWLDRQPASSVWTTSITVFEIRFGIELLAGGRRRDVLEAAFERALREDFEGRIAPFDAAAASASGRLAARRRQGGTTVDLRDTQIAGIVLARGGTLATRNLRHFADIDAQVIDPWAA